MRRAPLVLLLLLLPLASAFTPAHPHDHTYAGAGVPSGGGYAVPSCADAALPLDGDPESGVGGACFPYATVHGDDAGAQVLVQLAEDAPVGDVHFLVCLDYDWDGVCTSPFEVQDLCRTGSSSSGGISMTWPGPCLVYIDPAVIGLMLYVIPLPAHPLAGNAQPVSGRVWLT